MSRTLSFRSTRIVYYGPHPCQICGAMICKASDHQGGSAFNYPDEPIYPNTEWHAHFCDKPGLPVGHDIPGHPNYMGSFVMEDGIKVPYDMKDDPTVLEKVRKAQDLKKELDSLSDDIWKSDIKHRVLMLDGSEPPRDEHGNLIPDTIKWDGKDYVHLPPLNAHDKTMIIGVAEAKQYFE